jgi:hypothetical protein
MFSCAASSGVAVLFYYCFSKTLSYFFYVFDKIHFINSFSPSSVLTALNLGDKIVPTMNAVGIKIG